MEALRFSLGRTTTREEVERVVQLLKDTLSFSRPKVTVC
jgi:cysteine sulfinate desulfinase/cysteine desulfurase-like protein